MMKPRILAPGLSPLYYLENFDRLIAFVQARYPDLLGEDESLFLERFRCCPEPSRALFVRLSMRKPLVFHASRVDYPEIGDALVAAEPLVDAGLMAIVTAERAVAELGLGTLEVLGAYTRAALADHLKARGQKVLSNAPRASVEAATVESEGGLNALLAAQPLLVPLAGEAVAMWLFLFFGNRHQDLSEFVLEPVGSMKFEPYRIDPASRPFASRGEVDARLALGECADEIGEAEVDGDFARIGRCMRRAARLVRAEPSLTHHLWRLRARVGRIYERAHEWERALRAYAQCPLPPARERRGRVLERCGRWRAAWNQLQRIEKDPLGLEEREYLRTAKPRVAKKLGRTVPAQADRFVTLKITCQRAASVEAAVLEHLAPRWRGFHLENAVWCALFGLVFWDIIFMPLRGAFYHPFQREPADLRSGVDFYSRRKEWIGERLQRLGAQQFTKDDILRRFDEKYRTANAFVAWNRIERSHLELVLGHMPTTQLARLLGRMAEDVWNLSSGLPDLFVATSDGRYQLVEVKGPGDQLRPNQKAWLRFFAEAEIPAAVARVSWA